MQLVQSYAVRITNEQKRFFATIRLYQSAVKYLLTPALDHYDAWVSLPTKKAMTHVESLVHNTKHNIASYHFDQQFYKFPSYLRRSAIMDALGVVRSYRSLVKNWEDKGCVGKRPRLNPNQSKMPCFYRGTMFQLNPDDTADLKLYNPNTRDWEWTRVTLRKTDLRYLEKLNASASAPTLTKRNHRFELMFAYKGAVKLSTNTDLICAVDLGINTDAVCSIMRQDGTVLARKFLNCAKDKDYLRRIRSQIKDAQRRGNYKTPRLWRFQNMRNHELSIKTARGIVDFASAFDAQTIVFEYLDMQGKRRNQHLALWRKQEIQDIATRLAHRRGIRISRVSARNTSKLAFDGSGEVVRDEDNYSLCTFQTGKRYNCDLSASYNIGARYFIRKVWNTLTETQQAACSAKDPDLQQRTLCTLSTLIRLPQTLHACAEVV